MHVVTEGQGREGEEEKEGKRSVYDDYILKPFPKHKFEPLGWMDVLATVTICTNNVNPILFCDEEGYDIIPMQMVNIVAVQDEDHLTLESSIKCSLEAEVRHAKIENEISTFELSFGHETQGENYYDAFDELKDLDL